MAKMGNGYINILFLEKRCFKAWCSHTFGRVSPGFARLHYKRRLLKGCIDLWEESRVNNRRSWKLMIRAEYHDRYRIWERYFKGWKMFVNVETLDKENKIKAKAHGKRKLLTSSFASWKVYIQIKKFRNIQTKTAALHYERFQFRKVWNVWLYKYNNECRLKGLSYTALNYWAYSVLAKVFHQWKFEFIASCNLKKKLNYSAACYNRKILVRSLKLWQEHIRKWRQKKMISIASSKHYNLSLLQFHFKQWKERLRIHILIRKAEENIVNHGYQCTKRRFLYQLKTYKTMKKEKRQIENDAVIFYERKLMKKVITQLLETVHLRQYKNRNQLLAKNYFSKIIHTKYFKTWMLKCEHKEDIKQYPLSKIAYQYYKTQLLSKCIFVWKRFVMHAREKTKKYQLAVFHHNRTLLPRCFTAFVEFKELQKSIKELNKMAAIFNTELLYSRCFFTWLKGHKLKMFEEEIVEGFVARRKTLTVMQAFKLWRARAAKIRSITTAENKAINYHAHCTLKKAFSKWSVERLEVIDGKQRWSSAVCCYDMKLQIKCWAALVKYTRHCQRERSKEDSGKKYHENQILRRTLKSWKDFTNGSKMVYRIVEEKYFEQNQLISSWAFSRWKSFLIVTRREKQQLYLAGQHHDFTLKKLSLRGLRIYSSNRIRAKFLLDEATVRAQIRLQEGILKFLFKKWRCATKSHCKERKQSTVATDHYKTTLSKQSFVIWKQFTSHKIKMKNFETYSITFYTRSLERRHFKCWKNNLGLIRVENHKSNTSIFWWSYQLRKRVFVAWQQYSSQKRSRKQRYHEALLFRRNVLMDKGVTKWLQYSTQAMNRRRKIAYEEQMNKSMALQSRVHIFALRWLRKTQRAKAHRKLQREDQGLSVSFEYGLQRPLMSNSLLPFLDNPVIVNQKAGEEQLVLNTSSFKEFQVKFPPPKKRAAPRKPDYLYESFDLHSLEIAEIEELSFNYKDKFSNVTDVWPRTNKHLPVQKTSFNPRQSIGSLHSSALTDNEVTNSVLLPPLSFINK